MKYFLGLDCSTNCTGYTIINEEEELIKYGYIDTSKQEEWLDKTEIFTLQLKPMAEEFCFSAIGIEDILNKFVGGGSSAKTIISLARFNGLATYFCFQMTGVKPEHVNVLRARKLAMCHSVPRGINSKEYILKYICKLYPKIILPRMKRKDAIDKKAYDICDSVIIALAIKRLQHDTLPNNGKT